MQHRDAVPFGSAILQTMDPDALYARLHARGAVVPVDLEGLPAWLVVGYDAATSVFRDPRRFSRDLGKWSVAKAGLVSDSYPLAAHVTPMENLLFADGDEHRRLRGALRNSLKSLGSYRVHASIQNAADELIKQFLGVVRKTGHADLVAHYTLPLPVRVLVRLFGFPPQDVAPLQQAIPALLDAGEGAAAANAVIDRAIADHIDLRRAAPATDLVSGLIQDKAGLSNGEIHATLWVTLAAALGATTSWHANTHERLLRYSAEEQRTLNSGHELIREVMEETAWDRAPVQQVIGRVATMNCDLHGAAIRAGDLLVISPAAANRDPKFGTGPVRAARIAGSGAHLAFGGGEHGCPAEELARTIVHGAVDHAWTRIPDLHLLDPDQATTWARSMIVCSPAELLVTCDAGRALEFLPPLAPTGARR